MHDGRKKADATLAAVIAGGGTRKQAAEKAGVAIRTVGRRMQDPDFRAMVTRYRARMIDRALGSLAKGVSQAADKLVQLVGAEDEELSRKAANDVLAKFTALREVADVEERLSQLEERINATNATPPRLHAGEN